MLYRVLLTLLVVFVMAACSDAPHDVHSKNALAAPTVPAKPVVRAAATVGTVPYGSGASPAGEYQAEVLLDVPAGRAGMAPSLSLAYSSGAGRDNIEAPYSNIEVGDEGSARRTRADVFTFGHMAQADAFLLTGRVKLS